MKKQIALFFALMVATMISANNITINNIKLTGQNTTGQYTMVQFDISWENSWRTSSASNNWDAAWVFVKYRVSSGNWNHATLNTTGHTAPTGSTIWPASDGTGAFIYRNADGIGTFTKNGVQLRWNYGTNGVADNDVVDIQVIAIEMVYVPQGSFTVGSGGTESGSFTNGSWTSGTTIALSIASESTLAIAQTVGNLWGTSTTGNNTIGPAGNLEASFPKGYAAFYCMKYEISQQEYVDFLNSLTATQASNRYSVSSTGYRYGITVVSNVFSTTLPYVACNWLSWADLTAYLDWSGLRPMTELEFEKACRGTMPAIANEYAWGSTTVTQNTGITNPGLTNETSTNNGNCTYGYNASVLGPMRVGAFATFSSTRQITGATYYGNMEMSGNLWERPVTVGNTEGRAFTGTHGNGALNGTGDADASAWPGTNATGAGFRGGSWDLSLSTTRVSDRSNATNVKNIRDANYGGRGVRSEP